MMPVDLPSSSSSIPEFLNGGGVMGERIRSFDWSKHPLGPPEHWPQSLKIAVRIMLTSRYAMWMGWGPEFYFFCNDSYLPTLGIKEDWALGASAKRVWAEIWSDIGPRAESVMATGKATWDESLPLMLERSGFPEETYHTFSYSPLPDDSQKIGGMLCVVTEDTERVIGERRVAMLRELASDLTTVNTEEQLFPAVTRRMQIHSRDIPFALFYLFNDEMSDALLAGTQGVAPGSLLAPPTINLNSRTGIWPAREVFEDSQPILIANLSEQFDEIPTGPWDKPARQAIVVPMAQQGQKRPAGFLVAGINPYRPFDEGYRGFLNLLAGQVAAGLSNARAYAAERKRAEALAEIDRAKTTFFSNVSHEFRTPLTLMLGPLEDLLSKPAIRDDAEQWEELKTIHRNGLRLLKLVNSLLDFSRIEAGRIQAVYQQTDLAAYTTELASVFRSAMEKAGLKFIVNCSPITEPIFVDRDMWEKIVLNLLSNAYKFTINGEIEVKLVQVGKNVELTVRDTGAGIPEKEVDRVFERFHRVEGAQGRTHEGTGIGLALVQELVKLHGGRVSVSSVFGKGSTFTVGLPTGDAHLAQNPATTTTSSTTLKLGASPFIEEALRWSNDEADEANPETSENEPPDAHPIRAPRQFGVNDSPRNVPRILLADDNADMRDYVRRLLSEHYVVEAVTNGEAALKAALRQPPDLILTDVMMPRLDGFGLVRELRKHPKARMIPVIVLSARAGEESRVEGMEQGVDDYLTKPFSARELLSRVRSHLNLTRLRQEAVHAVEVRERELSLIYNNASDVIFYLAVESGERFRFVSVNPSFFAATGLSENQVLGKWVDEVIPEPSLAMVLNHYRQAIREKRTVRWEETSQYPSGKKVGLVSVTPIFDASGTCVNLIGTVHDITQRKQAEAQLSESEERFRTMADATPTLIWVTGSDKRCQYFNKTWLEFVGNTLGEQIKLGWSAGIHPGELQRCLDAYNRAFDARHPFKMEYPMRRHDGEYRWMLNQGVPRFAPDGAFLGYIGGCVDIDDQKRSEEKLEHLVAERTTRLRETIQELEAFSYSVSHDMRAPLRAMQGYADALLQEHKEGLDADALHYLERIYKSALRLDQLTRDVLAYSKVAKGEIAVKPIDLKAFLEAVIPQYPNFQPPNATISLGPLSGWIMANESYLTQIVSNLIGNAVKFVPRGRVPQVRVRSETVGDQIKVWVEDNGIGIASEHRERIFQIFGRINPDKMFEGTGIGLSIVKKAVERMGGEIGIESQVGEGSRFWFTLPGA